MCCGSGGSSAGIMHETALRGEKLVRGGDQRQKNKIPSAIRLAANRALKPRSPAELYFRGKV
jgi:hypothetical protein